MEIESGNYVVIFTSKLHQTDDEYKEIFDQLLDMAQAQEGFIGMDSSRDENIGISTSYWKDIPSIQKWQQESAHLFAQRKGKEKWYESYAVSIAKIERHYSFER